MSYIQEKLKYMNESMTQAEISRQTGIPKSTLSYVIRGLRDLPTDYYSNVTNPFKSTVYNNLRDIGFNTSQARLYRNYNLDDIRKASSDVDNLIKEMALGRTIGMVRRLETTFSLSVPQSERDRIYQDSIDIYRDSMRNSKKTKTDWDRYLEKEEEE